MFVIEEMRLTDSGRFVSDGFYGGIHEKYHDMIVITPEAKWAHGFETEEAAQEVASMYNKWGHNFIVRNRQKRQAEIDLKLQRLPWQQKMLKTFLGDSY